MKESLFAFLFAFVRSVLINVSQSLWEGLWEQIFEGIAYAEEQWEEAGKGEEKKDFVVKKVMKFINEKSDLGFIRRQAVRILVSRVIDGIVVAINEELGDNWVEKVEAYKKDLAGFISFIE